MFNLQRNLADNMLTLLAQKLNGGSLKIYEDDTLLVSLPLNNPCGSVASGSLIINTTGMSGTVVQSGTANKAIFFSAANIQVATADVGLPTSEAAIRLESLTLTQGGNISITSGSISIEVITP